MEVISPLSGTGDVSKLDTFDVAKIVSLYRDEIGLSVNNYFSGLDTITLYRCNLTGYRFYFPFSAEADSSFYAQLMTTRQLYYPGWKWENEISSRFIKDADKVLDVGCGDGAFIKELSKRKNVYAEGLELNPAALQKMAAEGLKAFNYTVQDYAAMKQGQYDVVSSFQVLEHIAHIKSFLSGKLDLLKPGGLMIIGVPYSNPYLFKKDKYHTLNMPPHHMGLWNEEAFQNLEKIFPVRLQHMQIEKIDDLPYYIFTQLGGLDKYKKVLGKYKLARVLVRLVNKLPKPPVSLIKGRCIIAVFRKL